MVGRVGVDSRRTLPSGTVPGRTPDPLGGRVLLDCAGGGVAPAGRVKVGEVGGRLTSPGSGIDGRVPPLDGEIGTPRTAARLARSASTIGSRPVFGLGDAP